MNILFVNPTSMPYREIEVFLSKSSILRVPGFRMPLGLAELSAYLRQQIGELEIQILDMAKDLYEIFLLGDCRPSLSVEEFIEEELNKVLFKPDVVGVSIMYSTAHNMSLEIINKAKKKWNKTIAICGGVHATNYVQCLLSNQNVDYVVRGEAELTLVEFIREVKNRNRYPNVHGIIDRKKLEDEALQSSTRLRDLDDLPLPAYDLLDIETYRNTTGACIMFSRGCAFKCTFCASHTVHGRKLRFKSTESILKNFDILIRQYNFDKIIIEDDLFAADKKKFLSIADKISKLKYSVNYKLPQGLSVAVLNEDIIDALIQMGINEFTIAIESGSPFVQKNIIKKNVNLPKAIRLLKYLRERDIVIYVNFILGFPGETKDLMEETIDFIKNLDVDWIYIFNALPLPGSEMFQQLVSSGIIAQNDFDYDGIRMGRRTFDTPEISAVELEQLVYDTNIECNFFNNSNLINGRYERAIKVFTRLIVDNYPFHIVGRYCRAIAYLKVGENEKSIDDLKECVKWICTNNESKRLFDRYGSSMVSLKPYLKG